MGKANSLFRLATERMSSCHIVSEVLQKTDCACFSMVSRKITFSMMLA